MTNFKPTLAATVEHESQLKFPLYASPKLDGIRALGSAQGLLSRTLKPIPNQNIQASFKSAIESHPQLVGLDGELTIGHFPLDDAYWLNEKGQLESGLAGDYNNNQSVIMSAGKRPLRAIWSVFDRYADQLTNGQLEYSSGQPYEQRYWQLKSSLKASRISFPAGFNVQINGTTKYANFLVALLHQTLIHSLEELQAYEEAQLSLGYEGIMVRHPQSPYKAGRSTIRQLYLAKVKRFEDSEAVIVGLEERMTNQNEPTLDARGYQVRSSHSANKVGLGTLGVLICEHPQFGQIRVGTGRGLDDSLRAQIWANQEHYLGKLIKFKYQPVGTQDKPRLPIFLGFRSKLDM